jgi:hypothetical protein
MIVEPDREVEEMEETLSEAAVAFAHEHQIDPVELRKWNDAAFGRSFAAGSTMGEALDAGLVHIFRRGLAAAYASMVESDSTPNRSATS